jgi:hypothetical protein
MSDTIYIGWHKSSFSNSSGNCVEVASGMTGLVAVRDTKESGRGPILEFAPGTWREFLADIRSGKLDPRVS